jgi:hypothetical protein
MHAHLLHLQNMNNKTWLSPTQPWTWRCYVLLCLFLIFIAKPKRNPLFCHALLFFLHFFPCACCIVVKLLSVHQILDKLIDVPSYFKISSTILLYNHSLSPSILIWTLTLLPLQKEVIVFNEKILKVSLKLCFIFPSCLINMIMLPFYQHLIPYFILMLAYLRY